MSVYWKILINKDNFADTSLSTEAKTPLKSGEVELQIERFALTANNITYAVLGRSFGISQDAAGYWNFFPYNEQQGLLPVWGMARVTDSQCEGVETGGVYYGFFPLASHVVMQPGSVRGGGFVDEIAHRQPLPGVYNDYVNTAVLPNFEQEQDLWPVFRPLYVTGFMIADEVSRNNFFEAEQIIVASASSKTASLYAHCHNALNSGLKVVGLTSARNKAHCETLGLYDQVVSYDDIASLKDTATSVYVDMAGNGEIIKTVYETLGDQLKAGILVGKSHWDSSMDLSGLQGPRMNLFFAPEIVRRRLEEWGPKGLQQKLGKAWAELVPKAQAWTQFEVQDGPEGAEKIYQDLLKGETDPQKSQIVALT